MQADAEHDRQLIQMLDFFYLFYLDYYHLLFSPIPQSANPLRITAFHYISASPCFAPPKRKIKRIYNLLFSVSEEQSAKFYLANFSYRPFDSSLSRNIDATKENRYHIKLENFTAYLSLSLDILDEGVNSSLFCSCFHRLRSRSQFR